MNGGSSAATVIQWFGATSGTMMQQQGRTVWGMRNICLDGRYRPGNTSTTNKADKILVLDRTVYSHFTNIRLTGWMALGLYIKPITTTANDNCMFNVFTNTTITGYNPAGVAMEFHEDGAGLANVCHNTFFQTLITHAKRGLDIYNGDNNAFFMFRSSLRPEATDPNPYGLLFESSGARSNYFFHVQSSVHALSGSKNIIFGFDRENGEAAPVVDSGASLTWTENGNNAVLWNLTEPMRALSAILSGDMVDTGLSPDSTRFTIYNPATNGHIRFGQRTSSGNVMVLRASANGTGTDALSFDDNGVNTQIAGGKKTTYGTAAPTTGTWAVGDKRFNTNPTAGGSIGWVCTSAGTPGTWKTFGTIAA